MNISNTWLHIGGGVFHRGHQAWYLNELRQSGDLSWHLTLANIRGDQVNIEQALLSQQGNYTLETIAPDGCKHYEQVKSICEVIPWEPELNALIDCGSDINTTIISFTVTEAGYYLDKEENLLTEHVDIKSDLCGGRRTIYGVISLILGKRRIKKSGPVTLICCDNLRHNGQRFYHGLFQYLQVCGQQDLLKWASSHITCPNTMVDRITPQPSADTICRVKEATAVDDAVPVTSETFIQWVIEDKFINERPALENVGVEIVADVTPYEEAKIRILNASHSGIAWAGTLAGKQYIHESIAEETIFNLVNDFTTNDVIPNLIPHPLNLEVYRNVVVERFRNAYILDTTQRVASDGLSKLSEFILPTIRDSLNRGHVPRDSIKIVSLFYHFLNKWYHNQLPYEYKDSVLDKTDVEEIFIATDPVIAFITKKKFFGALTENNLFISSLKDEIRRMNF